MLADEGAASTSESCPRVYGRYSHAEEAFGTTCLCHRCCGAEQKDARLRNSRGAPPPVHSTQMQTGKSSRAAVSTRFKTAQSQLQKREREGREREGQHPQPRDLPVASRLRCCTGRWIVGEATEQQTSTGRDPGDVLGGDGMFTRHVPHLRVQAAVTWGPCSGYSVLTAQASSRPKHLLVFINPFGGKGRGKRIYERKVAPLFLLASVTTEVIVTERANQAKETLYEVNTDKYDGIVCVGGDGMFSEVLHGLIGRTQRSAGVDQNQSRARLVPSPLRIGIIPAGSTDCVCYSTVGTNDAETSALHIILGDSLAMDVSSVHHNNMLLRYSVSLLGYGFYGDLIKDSEKKRWMGPARYDFSGVKTFLSHHCYEGTVSFLPARHTMGSPRDQKPCRAGCLVCRQSRQQLEQEQAQHGAPDSEKVEAWQVICGKFLAINATNMCCACPRSPRGLSPAAHLGDGTFDLILIRKCSRFNFLRFLLRHTNQYDQFDFSFVEVYRVKKFQFTSKHQDDEDSDLKDGGKQPFGQICSDSPACCCSASRSSWNCDGEILHNSAIEVRLCGKRKPRHAEWRHWGLSPEVSTPTEWVLELELGLPVPWPFHVAINMSTGQDSRVQGATAPVASFREWAVLAKAAVAEWFRKRRLRDSEQTVLFLSMFAPGWEETKGSEWQLFERAVTAVPSSWAGWGHPRTRVLPEGPTWDGT
ncbi:Ceramide kinase [Sciurus carolinensis]|uniref:Ceramide kinase n=1 Tax=Sciurus carolinensis TaxID=30640 RepID=A0AA41NF60_SCICA|nr:Ceramide kinase [Sciurus carolinensis]